MMRRTLVVVFAMTLLTGGCYTPPRGIRRIAPTLTRAQAATMPSRFQLILRPELEKQLIKGIARLRPSMLPEEVQRCLGDPDEQYLDRDEVWFWGLYPPEAGTRQFHYVLEKPVFEREYAAFRRITCYFDNKDRLYLVVFPTALNADVDRGWETLTSDDDTRLSRPVVTDAPATKRP